MPSSELMRALGRIEGQLGSFDKRLDDTAQATEKAINALRQDVVHANTELRRQVSDHEARIKGLEGDQAGRAGAFKLATILKDFSPWVVTMLTVAILILK